MEKGGRGAWVIDCWERRGLIELSWAADLGDEAAPQATTSYLLLPTYYYLPPPYYCLPPTAYLLPTSYLLLPPSYLLLLPAYLGDEAALAGLRSEGEGGLDQHVEEVHLVLRGQHPDRRGEGEGGREGGSASRTKHRVWCCPSSV